VELTTYLLLAPWLRMSRAIPLLPLKAFGGLLYGELYDDSAVPVLMTAAELQVII
jgi:hypothetical protein